MRIKRFLTQTRTAVIRNPEPNTISSSYSKSAIYIEPEKWSPLETVQAVPNFYSDLD